MLGSGGLVIGILEGEGDANANANADMDVWKERKEEGGMRIVRIKMRRRRRSFGTGIRERERVNGMLIFDKEEGDVVYFDYDPRTTLSLERKKRGEES